jgi:trans-aconitate 2-methyltransferase
MPTSSTAAKDFGPICDDYVFFETHATEAEEDLAAYLPRFREAMTRRVAELDSHAAEHAANQRCRVLDFGCGPGTFSGKFLKRLGCPADHLALTLVEPQPLYREQAAAALARFSTAPVRAFAALPERKAGIFDLILANHVLYYVTDLDTVVPAIAQALAPGGVFQTAIAGHDNPLIQFWVAAFRMLGRPVPYHTAESVATTFARHAIPVTTCTVPYRLEFPDTPANRASILRFLLGEYFAMLEEDTLRSLFDPFAHAGAITIDTCSHHFVVTAASG